MKHISSYKIYLKIMLILTGIAIATTTFFHILYRYDNKYKAKAEFSQDNICLVPENGICFLTDGWEFYPDKLLSPKDFADGSSGDIYYKTTLGDYPNLALFHEDENPYGVATYRLRIRGTGLFCLSLQEPLCAVKVFAGDKLVGESGNVTPENYRPLIRDSVYEFSITGETDLIIQTANYSHYYGGLYYPPALGNVDSISHMIATRMIFYGLLCFSSLSLALFSTAVWVGRKKHRDPTSFYFGFLALSFALRVSYPFLRLVGVPLVRPLYALEDFATLIGIYCVVRISLTLFAPGLWKQIRISICAVTMGMCAVGVVIPLLILPLFPAFTLWYGILLSWYKIFTAVFLVGVALHAAIMERPYAGIGLATATAYGICLLSNVFFINEFEPIRTGWQDEYGSFLLVLLFAGIMVKRSHAMAADNLRLTTHLQEEVAEKTQHLTILLKERSQLMAELSHDMKSPVTSLSNMVQIIQLNQILLDEDAQKKLTMMKERCDNLSMRLNSLQKLTLETSNLPEMHVLSLNQFLYEFHRNIQPVVEMSGPDFTCTLTSLPCTVLADSDKLSRALENLVFNAADFTPPSGKIQLMLERSNGYACIRVADTGCGIPKESLERIFDRFYTTRTEQGGQGLGLAITKSIVMEHSGEIVVTSEVEAGTVFTIRLPLLVSG